ncbi:peptide-N4-(N-acetyl-beta- glucosaminyl)asparagine amidase [Tritrichomonas musculus]|uniref:Peptide-N4-(N-acetyl-beta-glucosaminyl)asparagine amidase n=1 Tax=Tritrichomonas musculus TaxID=1915356 RepID=A0ABR2K0U2_9EUKA
MVKIIVYYHNHLLRLEASPASQTSQIFDTLKQSFQLEGNQADYYIWASKFYEFGTTKLQEIGNLHEARLFLVDKADKEKLDPFMSNILPSIVYEAANATQDGHSIISGIQSMHNFVINFSKDDVAEKVLSIIPFDRIDPFEGDAKVAEITKWFKEDFFTFVKEFPCHNCGGPTVRKTDPSIPPFPSETEAKYLASRCELYYCQSCGAITRFPRYNDVCKLLETRKGRCGEFANTFGAILKTLGYDIRLVDDFNDHIWVEFWSDEKGRYVHVDPCENIVDQPLTYEKGWGKKETWVIAVGENQCADVTPKYTQNIDDCIRRRKSLCPEEWYAKYIKFKNEEFLSSIESEDGRNEILEHQQKDSESMKNVRTETRPEEERSRISGNE